MFEKILVAMDSSGIGSHVVDSALALAKVLNGHLMLLHVLAPEEENSPGVPGFVGVDYYPWRLDDVNISYRKQWDEFESECLEMLRSRTSQAVAEGVKAEFIQIPGSAGETICQFAKNWGADLIVIGHRGLSGLSELILGSVSNYVLHHATCSVLTIQSKVVESPESVKTDGMESRTS
ncbi:MAG TPA: universal stress protein [Cyanobacteria bacterium UBA11149]|nr:universal stress protein [Cyanobacteria bacterium UBA11367]HBE60378.1 universal stress protein [Cyanobacteria bacterium UBA11366]HBK65929.1 universal stress protein [Cyanobacteria bacterium UBA11166]HBR73240.1 universal stress protein [Cyanobacteria bacterium UBA11159]HBS71725.1 universal stress protein [Cyanobacteria bacterium UBA11153]HBW87338.1 universal stress protein [Cyanobacteria bacterium UBA11149]HCA96231.1 universal stress protein [Cyanobacteria bacterium UBA9226]